jgi:hypothetical protein
MICTPGILKRLVKSCGMTMATARVSRVSAYQPVCRTSHGSSFFGVRGLTSGMLVVYIWDCLDALVRLISIPVPSIKKLQLHES